MSVELVVYLAREQMPEPEDWARAIADVGFPASLDPDFDVDDFSGFLPCDYAGSPAGFEYFSGPIETIDGLELPDDFDFSVTFVTHGSLSELAASTIAAAVLCSTSGGLLLDADSDAVVEAGDAIVWAREQLAEIERG